jgi:hypothetical protein
LFTATFSISDESFEDEAEDNNSVVSDTKKILSAGKGLSYSGDRGISQRKSIREENPSNSMSSSSTKKNVPPVCCNNDRTTCQEGDDWYDSNGLPIYCTESNQPCHRSCALKISGYFYCKSCKSPSSSSSGKQSHILPPNLLNQTIDC